MRILKAAAVAGIVVLAAAGASWGYSIDGNDSDWATGYLHENVDGTTTGIDPLYDIDVNRQGWESGTFYFYFRTFDSYSSADQNDSDYANIYIDADLDSNTGGTFSGISGFDYYMTWNLDTPGDDDVYLYRWDSGSSSWVAMGTSYTDAARGSSTLSGYEGNMFTEWSLDDTAIGSPDQIRWGAFLEGGDTDPDDLCPDELDEPGYVPEPTSMALMLLGLPAMVLLRRRRDGK